MTKIEQQDIVLKHLTHALKDTKTIRERINESFTEWFQSQIEVPKLENAKEGEEGGGEEGGGDAGGGEG